MALGGGSFVTQNKVLPGTYINFISAARAANSMSDRGYTAVPVELDWGMDGNVFTVNNAEFEENAKKYFGYVHDAEQMKPFRDLFRNAKTAHFYRLNSGEKAANTYAQAVCSGTRGNDIRIVILQNIDDNTRFDVITYMDTAKADSQTVESASELKANDYVTFKASATLKAEAGVPLTGGTNKTELTGEDYQKALAALESFNFNILVCTAGDELIKKLFISYTKRLRDEAGAKFQTVVHNYAGDYPGIINLKNRVTDANTKGNELVYWLGGAEADCAVNKTLTNRRYDGEYTVEAGYTQTELILFIQNGELCFHKTGDEVRVLEDINSHTTFTDEINSDFSLNQIIRVLDQYGNDIAKMFNEKYLGKIPNDADGRTSFWGDLDGYNKQMQSVRAVENYNPDELSVGPGEDKRSIVVFNPVQPVCAMEKCYMAVYVR